MTAVGMPVPCCEPPQHLERFSKFPANAHTSTMPDPHYCIGKTFSRLLCGGGQNMPAFLLCLLPRGGQQQVSFSLKAEKKGPDRSA